MRRHEAARMKRLWMTVSALVLSVFGLLVFSCIYAGVADAQEGSGVTLSEADITVTPDRNGAEVVENITLTGAGTAGGEIEHVAARPEGTELRDVRVTAGGRELRVDRSGEDLLERFVVSLPEGAEGVIDYRVSYTYSGSGDSVRVPMIVPALTTDAVESNISMELVVPPGEYVRDPFPLLKSSEDGAMEARMVGFPSYASFTLNDSPVGVFTRANLYTGLALALITLCCAALIAYERRYRVKRTSQEEVVDV